MQQPLKDAELIIEEKFKTQKIQLFEVLLKLLPFYDWHEKLMLAAEESCGFKAHYHELLFPRGMEQIITEISAWQDNILIEELESLNINAMTNVRTKEKIAIAIYRRIILNSKLAHVKYISYFISTFNLKLAISLAWRTCNNIWLQAGDKSVDFNYYTKRSLLLSVYISSINFYISDESPEDNDTKKFINDALDFVTEVAKLKDKFKLPKITNIPFLRLL